MGPGKSVTYAVTACNLRVFALINSAIWNYIDVKAKQNSCFIVKQW